MSDERPTSGPAPRWGEYGPTPQVAPPVPAVEREPEEAEVAVGPSPARRWDRPVTVGLLALGLFVVLTGIPEMLSLPAVLDETYRTLGYGDYTSDGLAAGIGIAINVVRVVLLIAAFVLTLPRLRAGRLSFWIPLVAGAVATVFWTVLMGVAVFGDPAFAEMLQQELSRMPSTAP